MKQYPLPVPYDFNDDPLFLADGAVKTFRIFDETDEEKIIFNETVKWTSVDLVGGVLIFPFELFRQINGYSNEFSGWGGEDDDMRFRLAAKKIKIQRPKVKYNMIKHEEKGRKKGSKDKLLVMLRNSLSNQMSDGLSNLKYQVAVEKKVLYTHLRVQLDPQFLKPRDKKSYRINNSRISLV